MKYRFKRMVLTRFIVQPSGPRSAYVKYASLAVLGFASNRIQAMRLMKIMVHFIVKACTSRLPYVKYASQAMLGFSLNCTHNYNFQKGN